uniref:Target of rapamycin complex subunit lst8 n=1 Tax=Schistocephalus solidus TaxID=70667 RepID=A0A183SD49_SCHSO
LFDLTLCLMGSYQLTIYPHQVNSLAFTNDGHYLAAAGYGKIRIYDVYGGASPLVVISEFTKNVNAVGHNAAGTWMFAGGEDKSAKILDCRAGGSGSPYVTGTRQILFSTDKGEVYVWDLRNGRAAVLCSDAREGPIHSIGINVEGTSLAAANTAGSIIVWSLGGNSAFKHTEKHRSKVHSSYALKVEFSPDSTLLATCGADGKVNLLKTADFSVTNSLQASSNTGRHWAWDCAFSADSRFLLTASSDGVARLWDLETNEVRLEYKGHQRAITCLAFRDQSLAD